ncbi:hypothetical protein M422DRAFT_242940 [Sphaerobolus stellatus SS14]|nr:hypothetical protein M422DRAFT_242940 [Sphaerobolus stellatus SS14]
MSSSRFKDGFLKLRNRVGNLLRSRSPSPTPSGKRPSPAPSQASHSNLISEPSAPSPHPRVSVNYPVENVLGSASTARANAVLDPHTAHSSHDAAAHCAEWAILFSNVANIILCAAQYSFNSMEIEISIKQKTPRKGIERSSPVLLGV